MQCKKKKDSVPKEMNTWNELYIGTKLLELLPLKMKKRKLANSFFRET